MSDSLGWPTVAPSTPLRVLAGKLDGWDFPDHVGEYRKFYKIADALVGVAGAKIGTGVFCHFDNLGSRQESSVVWGRCEFFCAHSRPLLLSSFYQDFGGLKKAAA